MEVEHSRLLKFLKESRENKTEMAEKMEIPVIKIEKDYQSPPNVEAEVPEMQKIRECDEKIDSIGKITGVNHTFIPTMSVTDHINSTITITGADFTFTPKITVTEKDNSSEITITNVEEGKNLISELKTTGGNFTFSPNVTITNKDNNPATLNTEEENNNAEIKITGSEDIKNTSSEKVTGSEVDENNSTEIKVTGADFTYSPVITVTKKESTLTKGDMKQQKVTVTEDIAEEDTGNGGCRISLEDETLTQTNGESGSKTVETSERRSEERVTEKMEGEENNQDDTKSKIPLLRLKQAAETVKREREAQNAKGEQPRRSSIPKLTKDAKKHPIKRDTSLNFTPQVDDEFDKLYEEIVDHKLKEVEEKLPSVTLEDPEKIETKFEEIIHAYDEDEHDKPTISRVSKIPALRRKTDEGSSRLGALIDRAKEKSTITETKLKDGGFKVTASTIRTKRISRGNSKDLSSEQQIEVTETIDISGDNDVFVEETVVKTAPTERTFRHITKRVLADNIAETDRHVENDSQKTAVTENLDKKDGTMNKTKRFNRTVSKETRERNLNRELSKNLQDIRREFRNRIEDSRIDPEFNDFDDHDITTKTTKENADASTVRTEKIIRGVSKELNKDGRNINSTETVTVEELEDGATRTVTTKTTESLVIGTPVVTEKIIRKISRERSTEGKHNSITGVTSIEETTDEGGKKITTYVRENATGIPVKTERFTRGISREMGNIKQRSRSKDIVTPVNDNKEVLKKETMQTELIEKEGVKGIPVYTKITHSFAKGKIENVEMSRTIEWKPADKVKTKNFSRSVSEKVTKKELKDAGKYETPVAISEVTDINDKTSDQNDKDEAFSAQKYPVLESKTQDNIKNLASKITTKKVMKYKSDEQIANAEKTPFIDFSRSVSENVTKKEFIDAGQWKYETPVTISEVTDIKDKFTTQNDNNETITKTNSLKYPVLESKTQDNIKDMANKITTKKVKEYKSEEQITNVEKTTYTLSSDIDLTVDSDFRVSREIGTQMSIDGKPVDRIFKYVKEFGTQMSVEGKSSDLSFDRDVKLAKEKNLQNKLIGSTTGSTTDKDTLSQEFGTQMSTVEKTVVSSFDGESMASKEFGTQMSVVGKIVDKDVRVSKEIGTQMSLDGTKQENGYNTFSKENTTTADIINEESDTSNSKSQDKVIDNSEVLILKGNVNRLRNMIAKETDTISKKEPEDELPKKKSVLSKIAIFERLEPKELHPVIESRRIKCKYVPPNLNRTNSVDRPKIVDEILKEPIQTELLEDTKQVEIGENYDEVTYISEPVAVTEYRSTEESNVTNMRQVTTITKATTLHSQQETKDFEVAKILPATIDFKPEESQVDLPKTTDATVPIQREPGVIEMPTIFPAKINYEADIGKTKPGKINLNLWSTQVEINKSTVDKIDVLKEESLHDIAQTLPGKVDFKTYESHVPVSTDLPGFTDFKIEENQIQGVTTLPARINFNNEEVVQTLVGCVDNKIDSSQNEVSDHLPGITEGYLVDDITPLPAKIDFKSYEIQTEVATMLPGKIEETKFEKTLTAFGFVPVTKDNKKTETNLKKISTKPKPGKINLSLWQNQVETNKTFVGKTDIRKSKEAEMTKALSGRPDVFNRDRKQIRVTETMQKTKVLNSGNYKADIAKTNTAQIVSLSEGPYGAAQILPGKIEFDFTENHAEVAKPLLGFADFSTNETEAVSISPLPETVNYSTASYSTQEEVATTLPAIVNFSASENQVEEPRILMGKIDFDVEVVNSESKAEISETKQDNIYYSSTDNNETESITTLARQNSIEKVGKLDLKAWEHQVEINKTLVDKLDVVKSEHLEEITNTLLGKKDVTYESHVGEAKTFQATIDSNSDENKVQIIEIEGDEEANANKVEVAKILPGTITIDPFKHTPRFKPLPMLIRLNSHENIVLENETAQGGKGNVYKVDIPIDSIPVSPGFSIESNPLSPGFSDPELDDEDTSVGHKRNTESIIGNIKRKLLFITNRRSVQDSTNTPMNTPVPVETDAGNDYEKRVDELQTKTYSISDISPKAHAFKTVSSLATTATKNTYDITTETIEESYSYTTDNNQSNFATEYEFNFDSNTVQNKLPRSDRQEDDLITSPSDFENNKNVTNENEFNFDLPRVENALTRSAYGADDFKTSTEELKRAKSLAELDLGDVVHGKVKRIVGRIKSVDFGRRGSVKTEINVKELPRKMSVLEKIALFEEKTAQAKLTTVRTTTKISTTPVLSDGAYRQNILELTTQTRQHTSTTTRATTTKQLTTPLLSEDVNQQKTEKLTTQRQYTSTTARTVTTEKYTTPILSEEGNHGQVEESTVQSKPYISTTARTVTTEKYTTPVISEEANQEKVEVSTVQSKPYISTTARTVTTEKYTTPVLTEEENHEKIEKSTVQSRPSISTTSRTVATEKATTPVLCEEENHVKIEDSTVQSRPSVSTTARTITTEKATTPLLSVEENYGKIEDSTVHSRPIVSTTARTITTEKATTPILSEVNNQKIEEFTVQSTPSVSTTAEKSTTPVSSEEANHQNIAELTTQSNPFVSTTARTTSTEKSTTTLISEEKYQRKIEDLKAAQTRYGRLENMLYLPLADGNEIPVLALGTALMDPRLLPHIIGAAIDMGYRAIDTAYIYGNEKEIGEGIKAKIEDGTVKREDLFIMSKLWSTYHRTDLVEEACNASLNNLGLSYFDLFMIHNPMSFKEGSDPIPKIASVVQYSQHDFLDAWYGMEGLVSKGLVKSIGVSNFNGQQIQRILDKGRIRPVVNQVENHPYLTQPRLDNFCKQQNITLSCFGVLGSKGTPSAFKNSTTPVIDDALVKVMASGLGVTPAQLLIRYQIERGHNVVAKASSAAHLWDNLQALTFTLDKSQVDALSALNRNKRTFVFKGMGDTHKNYPFSES